MAVRPGVTECLFRHIGVERRAECGGGRELYDQPPVLLRVQRSGGGQNYARTHNAQKHDHVAVAGQERGRRPPAGADGDRICLRFGHGRRSAAPLGRLAGPWLMGSRAQSRIGAHELLVQFRSTGGHTPRAPGVRGRSMRRFARACCTGALALLGPSFAAPQLLIDCEEWNTREFIRVATVADVKRCLRTGADPNATGDEHLTPLHLAAGFNADPALVEVLLEAGAALDSRSVQGITPLFLAAWFNPRPAVVETLLEAGADYNATTMNGNAPLLAAVELATNPGFAEIQYRLDSLNAELLTSGTRNV